MSVLVSIVVPTYKRTHLILRCMDALLSQEFEPGEYEIVIVDNAASEETRQAVEAWIGLRQWSVVSPEVEYYRDGEWSVASRLHAVKTANQCEEHLYANGTVKTALVAEKMVRVMPDMPAVKYVPANGKRGPAAARNCGWRAAEGQIIAFTDDDCIPDPEWLRSGVQAILDGHDGASGKVIVPLPKNPSDYEKDTLGLERSEFITANCFYRRAVLEAVGGFDERFGLAWREDSDLYFTLLKEGYDLVQIDTALVYHPVRPGRWGISIGQQKKAMYNALLYKKHARFYRQKIQSSPPWHYYLALAGLAAAAAGLIVPSMLLSVSGVALWLLVTLVFCALRLHGTSKHPRHIAEMLLTSMVIPPLAIYWRIRGALRFRVFFL
jgi:glycosyltransferase involved in cell wall biosynthesis